MKVSEGSGGFVNKRELQDYQHVYGGESLRSISQYKEKEKSLLDHYRCKHFIFLLCNSLKTHRFLEVSLDSELREVTIDCCFYENQLIVLCCC